MSFSSYQELVTWFRDRGASRVLIKPLSENDNTKNQIYLGGSFQSLQLLPFGEVESFPDLKHPNFKATVKLSWVNDEGEVAPAPHAQLILYPQYPEVRLSGFLRGCTTAPSAHMKPPEVHDRTGDLDGRLLFLAVLPTEDIIAYLASVWSRVATTTQSEGILDGEPDGVFHRVDLAYEDDCDKRIIRALRDTVRLGWQLGQRIERGGSVIPYAKPNAGGYTLEALLGIVPNGIAGPDLLGWEVKAHSGSVITLMTPEPDGGIYVNDGLAKFLDLYGHQRDASTVYFTGTHRYAEAAERTGLTLHVHGYDSEKKIITRPSGAVVLTDRDHRIAASWSFSRLIHLWGKKHNKAVYVSFEKRKNDAGETEFRYSPIVKLGRGTDFLLVLRALIDKHIYLDPGSKIQTQPDGRSKSKKRSQFRIKTRDLDGLYLHFETLDISAS
jgi:hypothetical protein